MKILIINSTSLVTVVNLMTDTTYDQRLFLNTFFTVSFNLSFNNLFFQSLSNLDDQSVSIFQVLVNIKIFVFLLSQKSAFYLKLFISYWLD